MLAYEREGGPPDERCLSFTHDKDYLAYRGAYPEGAAEGAGEKAWCPPLHKRHQLPIE